MLELEWIWNKETENLNKFRVFYYYLLLFIFKGKTSLGFKYLISLFFWFPNPTFKQLGSFDRFAHKRSRKITINKNQAKRGDVYVISSLSWKNWHLLFPSKGFIFHNHFPSQSLWTLYLRFSVHWLFQVSTKKKKKKKKPQQQQQQNPKIMLQSPLLVLRKFRSHIFCFSYIIVIIKFHIYIFLVLVLVF